ncbi:MAG: DUF3667 domain-containing protein [Candidatus Cryptobacteroides sp.]
MNIRETLRDRRRKLERLIELKRLRRQRKSGSIPYKYCKNCGAELVGPYCHQCGQQAQNLGQSFGSFIMEYFSNAYQFDRKIFPTVWQLFRRPGFLTEEFLAGKINSYVHPLKMNMFLLVVVVAVFVLTAGFHVTGVEDAEADIAEKILGALKVYLPIAILILSPFAALMVQICNIRRHRTYITHFVFTLHYAAFLEILILMYSGISLLIGETSWDTDELVFFLATAYLMAALQRVYGSRTDSPGPWYDRLKHLTVNLVKLFFKAMFINIMYIILFACAVLAITLIFSITTGTPLT